MTTYIYESPDHGNTVYRRETGSGHRELHSVSPTRESLMRDLKRTELWNSIHRAAENDLVLKDMLDQIEIYHALKNSP